jgi:hypothetical protein
MEVYEAKMIVLFGEYVPGAASISSGNFITAPSNTRGYG